MRARKIVALAAALLLAMGLVPVSAMAASASVIVSDNQVNATNVMYTFNFTSATTIAAGSAQFVVYMPNQDLSSVTAADVWTNNLSDVSAIYIDDTAKKVSVDFTGGLAAGTIVTVTVGKVTNQAAAGATMFTLETVSGGAPVESATAGVTYVDPGGIQNIVRVAKSMELAIGGPKQYVYAVNPVSQKSIIYTGNTISVKTNASSYTVAVKVDKQLQRADAMPFPDFPGTAAAPAAWGATDIGFGYTVSGPNADAKWGGGANYAKFSTAGDVVMSSDTPTGDTAHQVTVGYKLAVNYSVRAGEYSNTISFVVTPTY